MKLALFSAFAWSPLVQAGALDKREFSMRCTEQKAPKSVACDYRHSPAISITQLTGSINGVETQLDPKWLTSFPNPGESSAILVLLDVSDSRRAATLEGKIKPLFDKLLENVASHQSYGLAVFDSDIQVLAPLVAGSEAARGALKDVRAKGFATEFYKNILKGIEVLKKSEAQRRILILVSDGKAEDTAYTRADVLREAKDSDVSVLSLGYAERPSDAAYLQTLERLSAETHGKYLTGQKIESGDVRNAIALLERGGRVTIPGADFYGPTQIKLVFGRDRGGPIDLSQDVDLTDGRPFGLQFVATLGTHWKIWLFGGLLLVFLGLGVRRLNQSRRRRVLANAPFGALVELDAKGTRYVLKGSAVRLGRGPHNDLVFTNDTVSSNHAEILRRRDGSVFVNDLLSSNGVFVNSERVTELQLRSGDILEIGEVRLRYEEIGGG